MPDVFFYSDTNIRSLLRQVIWGNTAFRVGIIDTCDLPIQADELDLIFSIGWIEHFTREQSEQKVREIICVTHAGGTAGIIVP